MASLKIIALGLCAAVGYGILHDQVTARICVEYFTVGHPRIIASDSPTLLGLVWGVVATWWVGLPLGAMLALAARAGSLPKLDALDLRASVLILVGVMAICAALAGFPETAGASTVGEKCVLCAGRSDSLHSAGATAHADWNG